MADEDDRYLPMAFSLSRMTADRTDDEDMESTAERDRSEASGETLGEEGSVGDEAHEGESADGSREEESDEETEYGVVQEDAPDSIEAVQRPGSDDSAAHGPAEEFPDPDVDEPYRTTAPQSRFGSQAVTIGLLVLLVGVAIAFGIPVLVAG